MFRYRVWCLNFFVLGARKLLRRRTRKSKIFGSASPSMCGRWHPSGREGLNLEFGDDIVGKCVVIPSPGAGSHEAQGASSFVSGTSAHSRCGYSRSRSGPGFPNRTGTGCAAAGGSVTDWFTNWLNRFEKMLNIPSFPVSFYDIFAQVGC